MVMYALQTGRVQIWLLCLIIIKFCSSNPQYYSFIGLVYNFNSFIYQFIIPRYNHPKKYLNKKMTSVQPNRNTDQVDHDLVVPFRSKNMFINLLFMNTQISKVTYKKTIIFFILISLIFLGVSIYFFIEMSKVIEHTKQYYEPGNTLCTYCVLEIKQTMIAPVYVMYKLGNFYQNHRRYIQSKSNYQLAGNDIDASKAEVCSPKVTNRDMNKTVSWNNVPLDPNAVASPCGYIAYTYFTDTFKIVKDGYPITINQTGISWPGDKGEKYKRTPDSASTQWVDPEDEHFIVWMRTSGLPNFKKLWGVINQDLLPGNYTIQINVTYNSKEWEGDRFFLLTTKSAVGGKNYWLPSSFLVIGILGLIAVIFFWKKMAKFNRETIKFNSE